MFSGGRLILGLGAGWYEREYQAYDYPFLAPRERLRVLDETLTVVKRLWTEETVTFDGRAPALRRRVLRSEAAPGPAADLGRRWRRAGHARDRGPPRRRDQLAGRSRRVRAQVRRCCAGTASGSAATSTSIVRTHGPDCRLFDSERDLRAWLDAPGGGNLWGRGDPDVYVRDNLVGTVEQVAEKVQGFVDAGCAEFVLWFRDFPASESLERFMAEVVPKVDG